jgi:hypothetical protein
MADYYPLIARAIAGLDPNAPGESRRALYERARAALIAQLRSVQPPLSESEITRERLSLEEAVRKVESEAAQRARDASRAPAAASRAGDALRRVNPRPIADAAGPGGAQGPNQQGAGQQAPGQGPGQQGPGQQGPGQQGPNQQGQRPPRPAASSRNERPQLGQEGQPAPDQPRSGRSARGEGPPPLPGRPSAPPPLGGTPERPGASPRRGAENGNNQNAGVRGFRDLAADADDLGRAAAQASRSARKTYANVPSPELDRIKPGIDDRDADSEPPYSYDESVDEAERYGAGPAAPRSRLSGDATVQRKRRTGSMFPFKSAIAVGIVLILVGAGILWGKPLLATVSGLFNKSSQVVEAPKDTAPASKPKITDRVGQPSTSAEQVAPVAQRVVLYDEDPSDPKGKQYVGSVVWRTEPVKASGNQQADIAVRADIDVPDRKFKMTMSFRRNTDSSLPASHTAELTFILPPDFSGGGVANVPGILMKSNEQARGTPLAGLAVKVTDGFFLVGLSNVDADRARNIQLLKERSWFDLPLVYANQRRAIIAIEKGPPGERAFNDAFAAWGE